MCRRLAPEHRARQHSISAPPRSDHGRHGRRSAPAARRSCSRPSTAGWPGRPLYTARVPAGSATNRATTSGVIRGSSPSVTITLSASAQRLYTVAERGRLARRATSGADHGSARPKSTRSSSSAAWRAEHDDDPLELGHRALRARSRAPAVACPSSSASSFGSAPNRVPSPAARISPAITPAPGGSVRARSPAGRRRDRGARPPPLTRIDRAVSSAPIAPRSRPTGADRRAQLLLAEPGCQQPLAARGLGAAGAHRPDEPRRASAARS